MTNNDFNAAIAMEYTEFNERRLVCAARLPYDGMANGNEKSENRRL